MERFVEGEPEVDRFAKYAEQKLRVELDQDAIRFILLRVTEERPTEGPNVDDPLQRAGLKALSAEMIADCVIQVPLAEDVCDGPLFIVPELLQHRVEVFKRLTWFFVIDTCGIKIHQQEQLKVVWELFEAHPKATGFVDRDLYVRWSAPSRATGR